MLFVSYDVVAETYDLSICGTQVTDKTVAT